MEKSVGRSFEDQHAGDDDSSKNKKRLAVTSSKIGAARCTNRDNIIGLGHRLDKYQQQSNVTQPNKLHQVPVMNRISQKTACAGPGAKNPSAYNISKNLITEGAPSYNLRSKVQKTKDRNASINIQNMKTPKKDSSKEVSVAMQKREILKTSTNPVKKIETPKPVTSSPANIFNSKPPNQGSSKDLSVPMQKREILKNSTEPIKKIETPISVTALPASIQNGKPPKKDCSKDSSVAMQKREILKGSTKPIKKVETQKPLSASPANVQNRKPLRRDSSKDSSVAMQREMLKNSTKPIKKIKTPKPVTASRANLDRKNHHLTSQRELFFDAPVYHIRWEDVEKGPLGHNCVLCNKDLSRATEDGDDDSQYNDDFRYDVDDGYHDEYDHNPPLLPAVDILSCGHVYHTECLQKVTSIEQSSDPQCLVCYKTS